MIQILFYDTETTGLPKSWSAPASEVDNWPRLVQLGWLLTDENGTVIRQGNMIVKPDGFEIPAVAASVHGITTEIALQQGQPLADVIDAFTGDLSQADAIVGHNIPFDKKVVGAELHRLGLANVEEKMRVMQTVDTMTSSTNYCGIKNKYGRLKWPKLIELYRFLFGKDFEDAHDAMADITATKECYFELVNRGVIPSLNV